MNKTFPINLLFGLLDNTVEAEVDSKNVVLSARTTISKKLYDAFILACRACYKDVVTTKDEEVFNMIIDFLHGVGFLNTEETNDLYGRIENMLDNLIEAGLGDDYECRHIAQFFELVCYPSVYLDSDKASCCGAYRMHTCDHFFDYNLQDYLTKDAFDKWMQFRNMYPEKEMPMEIAISFLNKMAKDVNN